MPKIKITEEMINHPDGAIVHFNDAHKKCPSCGENSYGEASLDVGDIFLWNKQLKMVVGQFNSTEYKVVAFNNSSNIPAGISTAVYSSKYTLSKDFAFPKPIANIKDILPKKLLKFL